MFKTNTTPARIMCFFFLSLDEIQGIDYRYYYYYYHTWRSHREREGGREGGGFPGSKTPSKKIKRKREIEDFLFGKKRFTIFMTWCRFMYS
ncbi:hypothetical protein B0F90DRAFT_716816 [Multifurca ochricompacta]|uniref:Secreted protein n=1 Tax=Multifurca ochricompacta TaxID=376703 RepID=A0AAD4M3L6_9AGAM|nr:hypothetical protein B0F90DRAFT_716816 [Multifurca ochricompacta]